VIPLHSIDTSYLKDAASFEVLFRKWYAPLCKTLFNILKDKELAEDTAQEAFFVLWEKRQEVTISVKSYLYRAAINKAFNLLEKNKRFVRVQEGDWAEWEPISNSTEDFVNEKELQHTLNKAIDRLPPACKTVFLMSRMEEMSYKEIAEAMNISIKTVENQVSKALRLLRESMITLFVFLFYHFLLYA
jgi:RNA polymerase sigma-70 factor (ECF subfamily)